MRVLVVTVVHHPDDARIAGRQIPALVAGGHEVVYAAPFTATGAEVPPGVDAVDLPRATGRRRRRAVADARRVILEREDVDLVLLHDPELLAAVRRRRSGPPLVWDVHEDTAAALLDKPWLPRVARPAARVAVRAVEGWAARHVHIMLAEDGYRVRYGDHPVVPNEPTVPPAVPPPGDCRVVYAGRISRGRGAMELLALANLLAPGVSLELLGPADPDVEPLVVEAATATPERVQWSGRLTYEAVLGRIEGALAGLSLLHDLPNYRHSRPTKVVDYMSRGVPVVSTPTPVAEAIVTEHGCGLVVPFGDVDAVAGAVEHLRTHPSERVAMGRRGHEAAREQFNWELSGPRFVSLLEGWAEVPEGTR